MAQSSTKTTAIASTVATWSKTEPRGRSLNKLCVLLRYHGFIVSKYAKLIRNVKKTYPYAKQAGRLLATYNLAMKDLDEKDRKKLMKQAEEEINMKFTANLKKLTRSQGKVLIRLVDRETGNDSYTLVKELRGSFRAFFYQSLGKLFGYNLRSKYNPQENEEDRIIEKVIYAIETNRI